MTHGPHDSPALPYGRQAIDENDIAAVVAVLRGDWLTTGPAIDDFEAALAKQVRAGFAISCSSGTAALHLTAMALDLGPGKAAIVPSITFLATASAPRLTGAEILFADVDPDTGLIDLVSVDDLIRARQHEIAAIFPVHYAGQAYDAEALARLAKPAGIAIVEDACHALGTSYETVGEQNLVGACRHSDMAVFSFHPVKTITTAEGGAVTTNDENLARRLKALRNHGMTRNPAEFSNPAMFASGSGQTALWAYEMSEPGLNYRLSDIHAALGLSQLDRLGEFVGSRRRIVAHYDALLAPLSPVVRPIGRCPGNPAWHLYPVLIDFAAAHRDRNIVMQQLRGRGIGTQVHYIPVHRQPYYANRYPGLRLPGADRFYARQLSLPLFAGMRESDVERVIAELAVALGLRAG